MTEFTVLGLTGSIAMGKSTTAAMFRAFGVPVFDADRAVHDLMRPGGEAAGPVRAAFPDAAAADGGVDRAILAKSVFGDPVALGRLERLLHPRVRSAERRFLAHCRRNGDRLALLDIPLLFETGGAGRCDAIVVVSAPRYVQERRALARPGMTRERLAAILTKQVPDPVKRRRANFVVRTGAGLARARADVMRVVATCARATRRVYAGSGGGER